MEGRIPKEIDLTNAAYSWQIFKQQFKIYLVASGKHEKEDKVKVALLLNAIGEEALNLFNTFGMDYETCKLEDIIKAFDTQLKPKTNIVYERYLFFKRMQKVNEPFDSFLVDLKKLSQSCEFKESESLIRDRIVIGITDHTLQEKLLRDGETDLNKVISACRAAEQAKEQAHLIRKEPVVVDEMKKEKPFRKNNNEKYQCKKCGMKHEARKCPAYNQVCRKCKKKGHFVVGCQEKKKENKKVHEIRDNEEESELFIDSMYQVNTTSSDRSQVWLETIAIGNYNVKFKLDTGADCNVLPVMLFNKVKESVEYTLHNEKSLIVAYGNNRIQSIGYVILRCVVKEKRVRIKFLLLDVKGPPILGLNACTKLNLLKRVHEVESEIDKNYESNALKNFLKENKEVFSGIGDIPYKYKIVLKENANPVINPCRRIPLAIKDELKITLEGLEKKGVITKVEYPTDWVNNMVVVEKPNGTLRICLDPKYLNMFIKKDQFPIPTGEEIMTTLSGKSVFTVLDMKDGFLQISLDKESSILTTFITPFGKYKFNKLPFGLTVSPEVFQRINVKIFGDIPNVNVYFDDIIISGNNDEAHDVALSKVIERAKKFNVKFNINKVQYRLKQVKFLGLVFNKEGVKPDFERIKAIVEMQTPNNKKELLTFLGMINYLMKFIPNLTDLTGPLRDLIKNEVEWIWGPDQSKAFEKLKGKLSSLPTLKYFDGKDPIVIQCDASQFGLGACLMQNKRPVAYASRTLTKTEVNYAQIEKEMLAICFAVEKFHEFIYGREITVQTDHKPLISIINKDLCKVTARLQRLKLKLVKYSINLEYIPGKEILVADHLSRNCLKYSGNSMILNDVVHSLSELSMSEDRKKQFAMEVEKDEELRKVKQFSLNGWPTRKEKVEKGLKKYWVLRNEITIYNGILFYNDRVIVPIGLRHEMMKIMHEPHIGIEKTKKRGRKIMYWSGMSLDIERWVTNCLVCQKYARSKPKEPLLVHEYPELPWEEIGVDIMEWKGASYLVAMDYYSKWLEITPMKGKTANEVTKVFKAMFTTYGVPKVVISDNMPFNSYVLNEFANEWGFEVRTVSPNYPKANGLAEKAVGIAKNIIKKTEESGGDLSYAMLEYRNSPISGTNLTPAELLMNRTLRTKLPVSKQILKPKVPENVHREFKDIQEKSKKYYDRTAQTAEQFTTKENVFIHNPHTKVWEEAQVIEEKETPRSYLVKNREGKVYRKNSSAIRKDRRDKKEDDVVKIESNSESVRADTHSESETGRKEREVEDTVKEHITTRSGRKIKKPAMLNL